MVTSRPPDVPDEIPESRGRLNAAKNAPKQGVGPTEGKNGVIFWPSLEGLVAFGANFGHLNST